MPLKNEPIPTTQIVVDRLRPIYERAVRERTGVSFLLSESEAAVFSDRDRAALEEVTGYTAMCVGAGSGKRQATSAKLKRKSLKRDLREKASRVSWLMSNNTENYISERRTNNE